jgi:hypothetical protein
MRLVTALRVVIAALLVAFSVIVFLSFGKREEDPVRIHISQPSGTAGAKVVDLSDTFFITGTKGDSESFKLLADQVTGFVGDKKTLKGVHLFISPGTRVSSTWRTSEPSFPEMSKWPEKTISSSPPPAFISTGSAT